MNLLIDMDTEQRWGLQQALAGDSTLRINLLIIVEHVPET